MSEPLLIQCPACGARNRVAREELARGRQPVCGRCMAPLPEMISRLGASRRLTDGRRGTTSGPSDTVRARYFV